jgi:hypothetical protein
MRIRKSFAAALSILLLAMSSWSATCNPSYSSSERRCPCCPATRTTPSEKLSADRARGGMQIGQASAQRMEQTASHIENTLAWSNSPTQCNHQSTSQVEVLGRALRGANRTQFNDCPLAAASEHILPYAFVRSSSVTRRASPHRSTSTNPLSLSLRI